LGEIQFCVVKCIMKTIWDERYSKKEYAYGEEPNTFLKQELEKLTPGKILFPAEGEGRNAVFAARHGWTSEAFDVSAGGKVKADLLAAKHGVSVSYAVGELREIQYEQQYFDAMALIYVHFPPNLRQAYHRKLSYFLKPGGIVILEAFNQQHPKFQKINPQVGGPLAAEMLYSKEQIESDFPLFDILHSTEEEIELREGLYHVGRGSVVRFVARKKG
jgi:2-polyprenyl-3-methyl-5-hydroxy-6-metoxy-1,4-benzoquinol methylase